MKIILTDSRGNKFAEVSNWDYANMAAKAILKRNYYSDLYYSISFDNGDNAEGSIDLEPRSFHSPYINTIVTKHLKTWWGNISNLPKPKYGITQEDINHCKNLLVHLP